MSARPIAGAANFNHLLKVVSARFFYCKDMTFLTVINKFFDSI